MLYSGDVNEGKYTMHIVETREGGGSSIGKHRVFVTKLDLVGPFDNRPSTE